MEKYTVITTTYGEGLSVEETNDLRKFIGDYFGNGDSYNGHIDRTIEILGLEKVIDYVIENEEFHGSIFNIATEEQLEKFENNNVTQDDLDSDWVEFKIIKGEI